MYPHNEPPVAEQVTLSPPVTAAVAEKMVVAHSRREPHSIVLLRVLVSEVLIGDQDKLRLSVRLGVPGPASQLNTVTKMTPTLPAVKGIPTFPVVP